MNIYSPYTYLIGWSKLNKWYYGVRFAKNCSPNDLWKTYFTSSKYVKKFKEENGDPDVISIRKVFKSAQEAINWEDRVIMKMKLYLRDDFLNMNRSKGFMLSPETIQRINSCEKRAQKISKTKRGKKLSLAHVEKSRNGLKQYYASLPQELKSKSIYTRKKMSEAALKKNIGFSIVFTCPKCGKESQKANISKHHGLNGEKCRW